MSPTQHNESEAPGSERPATAHDALLEHKVSVRQLFSDYEFRAKRIRIIGFLYLIVMFILLGFATSAVVFAPWLARFDTRTLFHAQAQIEERRNLLAEINAEIDSQTIRDLHAVLIGRNGRGIAVGEDGTVVTSARDTQGWEPRQTDVGRDLLAAAVSANGENVVAVGRSGTIVVSDNDGRTWDIAETSTRKRFNDVAFGNGEFSSMVIAVGDDGAIHVSSDDAKTWEEYTNASGSDDFHAVTFIGNTGVVVAVGDAGTIVTSRDGGKTWRRKTPLIDQDLHAVSGAQASVVAVGENGTILLSTDVAEQWLSVGTEDRAHDFLAVELAPDGTKGLAVGFDGIVFVADKDLTSWNERESNTVDHLNVVILDEPGAIAVAAGSDGTIIVSDDDWTDWHTIKNNDPNEILAATFTETGVLFAGRDSTVLLSELESGENVQNMVVKTHFSGFEVNRRRELLVTQRDTLEATLKELEENRSLIVADYSTTEPFGLSPFFYQTNALRLAVLAIAFFICQHLMGLVRYSFRLSEYYYARRNVLLLTMHDTLPWSSLSTEEFERIIESLSPELVEHGRTSQSAIDLALRLSKAIARATKRSS